MKTIDYKFCELCEEIDFWKSRAKHFEKLYEDELQASNSRTMEDLERTKKGVANALMFAISVKDNPDGSLSISKEDRKQLSENYK